MNNTEKKDIKRSVRDKYNRRLKWLSHAVVKFEYAAEERIKHGGNIRNREEIEAILKALETLKIYLPEKSGIDEETNRRLSDFFDVEYTPLKKNT